MAGAPLTVSLWPDGAPLGNGTSEKVEVPITVHLPGPGGVIGAAFVICPGGGYGGRVMEGEGHGIARWLNAHGIAGVVLAYRLPSGNYHRPMLDAQRVIRVVRAHAAEWKLDPHRIGIIGFSAGGHLASTVGTHFDAGNEKSADPVERQVTAQTPPTFLTHAGTDEVVPVEHSQMFDEALKAHGVPAELQVFPKGNHGFNGYQGEEWDAWQKRCLEWLSERD